MECPNCKLDNVPDAERCDCGYVFEREVEAPSTTQVCPYCAETIQAAAIKCRYCGEALDRSAVEVQRTGRKTSGLGIAAVVLGIAGAAAPYFAAVFLVPLAFVFGAIAYVRGDRKAAIAGILFAILGTIGIVYTSERITAITADPFNATSEGSRPIVTMAEYSRIQEGMSYLEVARIIGEIGEELSRSDLAGMSTVMYAWKNANGSNMNAMFQNDRLVNKAQFGLR